MRVSVAVMIVTTVLVGGVFAISESASQVDGSLNSTSENTSYAVAENVFGGTLSSAGPGIIWFGVAAIVLVSLGLLVYAGSGGR